MNVAKSAKETREEIAALKAMLEGLDKKGEEAYEEEEEEEEKTYSNDSGKDPNEIVEIQFRRKVKRKHFNTLKHRLTCVECNVDFLEYLPAKYEGILCGENCAMIVIEKARELLAAHYSQDALPVALRLAPPAHLDPEGVDPEAVPGPYIEDAGAAESEPEAEPEDRPLSLEEKLRLRLKSS